MAIFHKQNGHTHNPHSLRDQYRNKKSYCRLCGELECQSCKPASFWEVFGTVVAWLIIAAAVCVGISYAYEWAKPQGAVEVAQNAVYVDKHGNIIEAQKGLDLGRGIKSNWESQK